LAAVKVTLQRADSPPKSPQATRVEPCVVRPYAKPEERHAIADGSHRGDLTAQREV